jgi:hypothetical protein
MDAAEMVVVAAAITTATHSSAHVTHRAPPRMLSLGLGLGLARTLDRT